MKHGLKLLKLALIAIMACVLGMPVGAEIFSMNATQNENGVVFEVVSTEPVACVLNLFSSAHQEVSYPVTEDFSVTMPDWDLAWSMLFCNGSTAVGDTQIFLPNGYTVEVVVIIEEPPSPEPAQVTDIEYTNGDYFVFQVFATAGFTPECKISHLAEDGSPETLLIRSYPYWVDGDKHPHHVSLTCEGITKELDFGGNDLTHNGQVVLINDSTGRNGGTHSGGRPGNNTKPKAPDYNAAVDEQNLRCWFGAVHVYWNTAADGPANDSVTVYGPSDVGGSADIILLGAAPLSAIMAVNNAEIPNSAMPISLPEWVQISFAPVKISRVGDVIKVEIRDTRGNGHADVCEIGFDGALLRTYSEG